MWIGKNPEQYATDGLEYVYDHMEFDYPGFEALKRLAMEIVNNDSRFDEDICNLLTVLALDNEGANMLYYIEENSSEEQLRKIIKLGIAHLQPEARWQLAEIIYQRRPPNYKNYLTKLSNDNHPYVRKRASNCLEYLKEEK